MGLEVSHTVADTSGRSPQGGWRGGKASGKGDTGVWGAVVGIRMHGGLE